MAKLINVPTVIFKQGDLFEMESDSERPIHIDYYRGSIVLRQDGNYDTQEEIIISPKYLVALFKEIKKHLPAAEALLK